MSTGAAIAEVHGIEIAGRKLELEANGVGRTGEVDGASRGDEEGAGVGVTDAALGTG